MANYTPLGLRAISVPSIVNDFTDAELNSGYHSKVEYEEALDKYGPIYKVVDFSDLTKKADIEKAAKEWIRQHYFDGVRSFNVKAVDLHLLGFNKDKIKVGDRVTVEFLDLYKVPVRKTLTCLSAQIDILNPGNSTYKIGIPDTSLSSRFRYTNSRGGSTGKKSSSYDGGVGGGVGALYKYYKELENTAQIQTDQIEFLIQNLNVQATDQIYLTAGQHSLQKSAVIQNGSEIVNVVGNFRVKENYYDDWPIWDKDKLYKRGDRVRHYDEQGNVHGYVCAQDLPDASLIDITDTRYWTEIVGRKGIELLDGIAFELDDYNGSRTTFGKKLHEHDQHFETYDGSALWQQQDKITGVVGEYDIYTDPETGKKTLIIIAGGGIKIRKDSVDLGIYDEDTLKGGIIVDKINTVTWTEWAKNIPYTVGAKVSYHGFGYVCKTAHTSGNTFNPAYWEKYTATNTKILGEQVDIKAEQLVQIGVYTNDSLTGGMIVEKINAPNRWYSGVHYAVGDKVQYDGATYKCVSEHTSGTTFDSSKWQSYHATKIDFNQLDSTVTDYTAMGLFDNDTLTGGILVQKLNDPNDPTITTETKIVGDRILAGDSYTKGYLSDDHEHFYKDAGHTQEIDGVKGALYGNIPDGKVYYWDGVSKFVETSKTLGLALNNMNGLIADRATIGQLDVLKARVGSIEADYITTENLSVNIANITTQLSSWDARFYRAKANDFLILGSDSQGHETTASVKTFIKNVQVVPDGSNYVLQYKTYNDTEWQNAGTFNRAAAVTLSGDWSGGIYYISATQGSISGDPPNPHLSDPGLGVPVKGTGSTIDIPYDIGYAELIAGEWRRSGSTGKTGTANVNVSSLLQTRTVYSNDTYTPIGDYIGIGSITVSVPDISRARTRFVEDTTVSGVYYVESYDNVTGYMVSNSRIQYQLKKVGSTSSTKVQIFKSNGTEVWPYTPEINVGSLYTDGHTQGVADERDLIMTRFMSAVGGSYYIESCENGQTPTPLEDTRVYYKLVLTGNETNSKVQIQYSDSSGTQIPYSCELPVGSLYSDGQNSVYVDHTDWTTKAAGESGYGSITFKPSAGSGSSDFLEVAIFKDPGTPTDGKQYIAAAARIDSGSWTRVKTMLLAMTPGGWSSGTNTITLTADSTTECTLDVSIPNVTGFDTTHADTSHTVSGRTNNGFGYYITSTGASGVAGIVTKGTFSVGGKSFEEYSYMEYAPSRLYRAGYSDGNTDGYSSGYTAGVTAERNLVKTRFMSASGSYYIEAYENGSSPASISTSYSYYQLGLTGSGTNSKVQIQYADSSGTYMPYTPELSVGSVYTSGRNSVTISSIEVYGSPAASATSISVKATASNGNSDIGSINITTQRNNAYDANHSTYIRTSSTAAQVTSITLSPGQDVDLYPAFDKTNGMQQFGTPCTVTASQYENSMSITRVPAGRNDNKEYVYYGKLYYWDEFDATYKEAYASNQYWYRSSTNRGSGSKTVYWA